MESERTTAEYMQDQLEQYLVAITSDMAAVMAVIEAGCVPGPWAMQRMMYIMRCVDDAMALGVRRHADQERDENGGEVPHE